MTITLTREEAQQVLEHLDDLTDAQQWEIDMHITQYSEEYKPHRVKRMKQKLANTNSTIETLRARLSAPERSEATEPSASVEPVAWLYRGDGMVQVLIKRNDHFFSLDEGENFIKGEPLYTALPQREWQGLTDEEIDKALWENESNYLPDIIRIAEAKLKEKNS